MSAPVGSRCEADAARQHDTGRKKTSDQIVSDPIAVCLPNMTMRINALALPTATFPLHDVFELFFARSPTTRDQRVLKSPEAANS